MKVLVLATCVILKLKVYGFGVLQLKWISVESKLLSSILILRALKVLESQMYMMIGYASAVLWKMLFTFFCCLEVSLTLAPFCPSFLQKLFRYLYHLNLLSY